MVRLYNISQPIVSRIVSYHRMSVPYVAPGPKLRLSVQFCTNRAPTPHKANVRNPFSSVVSGPAGNLKSFGRRQAYESRGRTNPRSTSTTYGEFDFGPRRRTLRRGVWEALQTRFSDFIAENAQLGSVDDVQKGRSDRDLAGWRQNDLCAEALLLGHRFGSVDSARPGS